MAETNKIGKNSMFNTEGLINYAVENGHLDPNDPIVKNATTATKETVKKHGYPTEMPMGPSKKVSTESRKEVQSELLNRTVEYIEQYKNILEANFKIASDQINTLNGYNNVALTAERNPNPYWDNPSWTRRTQDEKYETRILREYEEYWVIAGLEIATAALNERRKALKGVVTSLVNNILEVAKELDISIEQLEKEIGATEKALYGAAFGALYNAGIWYDEYQGESMTVDKNKKYWTEEELYFDPDEKNGTGMYVIYKYGKNGEKIYMGWTTEEGKKAYDDEKKKASVKGLMDFDEDEPLSTATTADKEEIQQTDSSTFASAAPGTVISSKITPNSSYEISKDTINGQDVFLTHIKIKDGTHINGAPANGSYGSGLEKTSSAAKRLGATIAINGSHFDYSDGSQDLSGPNNIAIVNGEIKKNGTSGGNELLIYEDGHIGNAQGKTAQELVDSGVKYSFSCHSVPVIQNGDITRSYEEHNIKARTVIGQTNSGDYYIVTDTSPAVLSDTAKYLQEKGVVNAYSLDQGGSVTLVNNGNVINSPSDDGGERSVGDILYFTE